MVALPRAVDDAALVAALVRGAPWAGHELYVRHGNYIRRTVLGLLGPDRELEDVSQQVFVQVFRSIGGLRDPHALKGWLRAVCVHVVRRTIRSRMRRRWLTFRSPPELPEMEAQAPPDLALQRAVYGTLASLPVELRLPLTLRWVEDLPLAQVAAACNVSLATVKRRLTRAGQRFAKVAQGNAELQGWLASKNPGRLS